MEATCFPLTSTPLLAQCSLVHGRLTPTPVRWQCQLNFKPPWEPPWTAAVPVAAASYVFKSHDPLVSVAISHVVGRSALSRLPAAAAVWAHIPVCSGNTFLQCIGGALCSVNNMPTLCCSVKTSLLLRGSVTVLSHQSGL